MVDQKKADSFFRESLSNKYTISWATGTEKSLKKSYSTLVDVFGERISIDTKKNLVTIMIENTGFVPREILGRNSAMTYFGKAEDGPSIFNVSVCLYKKDIPRRSDFYHEGIHFLSRYGDPNERIIKQDVPLANVVGEFIDFQDNPTKLEKLSPEIIRSLEANPFKFCFKEHEDAEIAEAVICAANAHLIAREKGEKQGLDYIIKLAMKGNGQV